MSGSEEEDATALAQAVLGEFIIPAPCGCFLQCWDEHPTQPWVYTGSYFKWCCSCVTYWRSNRSGRSLTWQWVDRSGRPVDRWKFKRALLEAAEGRLPRDAGMLSPRRGLFIGKNGKLWDMSYSKLWQLPALKGRVLSLAWLKTTCRYVTVGRLSDYQVSASIEPGRSAVSYSSGLRLR